MLNAWQYNALSILRSTMLEQRELEITAINAVKAISYSQEVNLQLDKLITQENSQSIEHNPAVQVGGLHADNRRKIAHKETMNPKTLTSLTAPSKHTMITQALRNRRCSPSKTASSYTLVNGKFQDPLPKSTKL